METVYLGVDVAGARNTWLAGLSAGGNRLVVCPEPQLVSLHQVVETCEQTPVVAVAIDAQLTISLSAETGFRASDRRLRELLPPDCRNWVASINSLMAVPVRGQLLAEHLAPLVGTLLETHPRASLLFGLGEEAAGAVRRYKSGGDSGERAIDMLWERWAARFDISLDRPPGSDGALDALVCATVAYLYHQAPENLLRLREQEADDGDVRAVRGWEPFYVAAPHG